MAMLRLLEVAQRLGMGPRAVVRLVDAGELPQSRDGEGHLVIDEAAVLEYDARRQRAG